MSTTIDPAVDTAAKTLRELLSTGTIEVLAKEDRDVDATLESLGDREVLAMFEDFAGELRGGVLTDAERTDVLADRVTIMREAVRRGILEELACIYCACTEDCACSPPCGWLSKDPPICDAPSCVAKHEAALAVVDATIELANPPITDVEASTSRSACVDCGASLNGKEAIHVGALQWRCAPFCQTSSAPARASQPYESVSSAIFEIALDVIAPDPAQARDEGADDSIGDTLKPTDVLPAIELRVHPKAGEVATVINYVYPPYMIIDGERRWRGSKKAGRTTIRAWVNPNPGDDGDRLLRQAVLNEGKQLLPMEQARTWKRIKDAKGWKIQQLAEAVGRPKSTVSDRLAMLEAPAQFQPLFADGTLSAAAAPIVRQIAHLAPGLIDQILERVQDDYQWQQHVDAGKTLPLELVGRAIGSCLNHYPFTAILDDFADYTGETFEVKGKRYAVDRAAYNQFVQDQRDARADPTGDKSHPADDYAARGAADARRRRLATENKRKLRRAQFDAISAKLPTTLDGTAALVAIGAFVREMQQLTQVAACKALGVEYKRAKGSGLYSANFPNLLTKHAESLDPKGRVRMLLQLSMASDLAVGEWDNGSADRIAAAARLARIDLKKVKQPVDAKAKKAPAKPVSKKRR